MAMFLKPESQKLLKKLLTKHEGYKRKLYKCTAGKTTGGIGHNFDDNELSDAVIDLLYHEDIENVFKELRSNWPWLNELDDARKIAICDMAFNLGIYRFGKFRMMLCALDNELWDRASDELLNSKYATQVGNRAKELANIIRTGKLPRD